MNICFFHCLLTSLLRFYSFRVPVYLVEVFQQYSGITGEEHSNTLQYSCLENPMDRGAWWATVRGVAKSQTQLKRGLAVTATHCYGLRKGFLDLRACLLFTSSAGDFGF